MSELDIAIEQIKLKVQNGKALQEELESRTRVLTTEERFYLVVDELVSLKHEVLKLQQINADLINSSIEEEV